MQRYDSFVPAITLLALSALSSPAIAQDGAGSATALIELLAASRIECRFPATEVAGDTPDDDAIRLVFSDIDVRHGTARGGDETVGASVRSIPTNIGLHFYQFSSAGAVTLTTVYADGDASGYPTVLSRHHTGAIDERRSQRTGTCMLAPEPSADAAPSADSNSTTESDTEPETMDTADSIDGPDLPDGD